MSRRARRWELARELKHADAYTEPSDDEGDDAEGDGAPAWSEDLRHPLPGDRDTPPSA